MSGLHGCLAAYCPGVPTWIAGCHVDPVARAGAQPGDEGRGAPLVLAPASSVPQLPLGTSLPMSECMSLLTCKMRDTPGLLLKRTSRHSLTQGGIPSGSGSASRKSSALDICSGAFADAADPWLLSLRKDVTSSAAEHESSLHRRQSCFLLLQCMLRRASHPSAALLLRRPLPAATIWAGGWTSPCLQRPQQWSEGRQLTSPAKPQFDSPSNSLGSCLVATTQNVPQRCASMRSCHNSCPVYCLGPNSY